MRKIMIAFAAAVLSATMAQSFAGEAPSCPRLEGDVLVQCEYRITEINRTNISPDVLRALDAAGVSPPAELFERAVREGSAEVQSSAVKKLTRILPYPTKASVVLSHSGGDFSVDRVPSVATPFIAVMGIVLLAAIGSGMIGNSSFNRPAAVGILVGVGAGIFAGGVAGLIAGLIAGMVASGVAGLIAGLIAGMVAGGVAGMFAGVFAGVFAGMVAGVFAGVLGITAPVTLEWLMFCMGCIALEFSVVAVRRMRRAESAVGTGT